MLIDPAQRQSRRLDGRKARNQADQVSYPTGGQDQSTVRSNFGIDEICGGTSLDSPLVAGIEGQWSGSVLYRGGPRACSRWAVLISDPELAGAGGFSNDPGIRRHRNFGLLSSLFIPSRTKTQSSRRRLSDLRHDLQRF